MKTVKLYITKFPEYYLLLVLLIAGYTPPLTFNPIIMALIAIIILQLITKNNSTGLIIASVFLLLNVYMLFALASEFTEFQVINANAVQLLLVGIFLLGL